jgi:hypothetical protein
VNARRGDLAPVRLTPAGAVPSPYPSPAGTGAYAGPVSVWTDPAKLPADRSAIPDTDEITLDVWAVLQGVTKVTAESNLSKSGKRRAAGDARPGDMPEPGKRAGQTPLFTMGVYREWAAQRPGKGSSLGKAGGPGSRGGRGAGKLVRLPVQCPHCHHEITAEQLDAATAVVRDQYGQLRDAGISAAGAAARMQLPGDRAKSLEMAWRRAGRPGPLEEAPRAARAGKSAAPAPASRKAIRSR